MQTLMMAKDFIFNAVFNDVKDTMPITHLLADYLGEDYEELKKNITLIPRELGVDKKRSARFQVDILIKREHGNIENIELNASYDNLIIKRNNGYATKIYSSNYPKKAYDTKNVHIPSLRQINFCLEVPERITNNLINECFLTIKGTDIILTDDFEIDVVDMAKIDDPSYNYVDEREERVARWCKILKSSDSEVINKELKKIMSKTDADKITKKVEDISQDSEFITLNDEYDKVELEKAGERNLGREEGIKGTAKKMLDKKYDIKDISEITGLSKNEIESLR